MRPIAPFVRFAAQAVFAAMALCAGVLAQDCPVDFNRCPPTFYRPPDSIGPCRPLRGYGALIDIPGPRSEPRVLCSHARRAPKLPTIVFRLTEVLRHRNKTVQLRQLGSYLLGMAACRHTIITISTAKWPDVPYATFQKIVVQLFEVGLMEPTSESANVKFESESTKTP